MALETKAAVKSDDMEIDLMRLFMAVWHRAWAVVLATVVGAVIAFSYAVLAVTPLYESRAMMYVNNSSINLSSASLSISSTDISASKSLVDTYAVILGSRSVLEKVIEKAKLDYTYGELYNMVEVSSVNSTEIFQIVVTSADPKEAALIANTIVEVFPDVVYGIIEGSGAKVVDYAVVPTTKLSPNVAKITVIGALLGFVICVGIIVVLELMDNLVHNEDYLVTNYKDIPILASIPDIETGTSKGDRYGYYRAGGGS